MISSTTLLFLRSFSPNFSLHHRSFPSQSQRRRRMVTAPPTFGPNCLRLPDDGRARGRTGRGRRKISLFAPAPQPTERRTDSADTDTAFAVVVAVAAAVLVSNAASASVTRPRLLLRREYELESELLPLPLPPLPRLPTHRAASERAGRGYSLAYSLSHEDRRRDEEGTRGGALPSQVRAGEPTSRTRAQWRRAGQRRRRLVCERRVGGEEGGGGGVGGEPGSLDTSAKRNVHSMPPVHTRQLG